MYFLDELDNCRLYKRKYLLPINDKDKRHGSLVYLLGPNLESNKKLLTHPLFINKYFNALYAEKAVLYYVNNEGVEEFYDEDYITEKAELYNKNPALSVAINFSGYNNSIDEAKKYLTGSWFAENFKKYGLKPKKVKYDIQINITDNRINSTKNTINLVPYNKYPKDFESYEKFCYFNALMYIFYQVNPEINDWLCMACAIRECGITIKYDKRKWPFNINLYTLYMGIDRYIEKHSYESYIKNIIRGDNGIAKLDISFGDLAASVYQDIKDLFPDIFGETCMDDDPVDNEIKILTEDYSALYKKMLFKNRMKSNKELNDYYDKIKEDIGSISFTYTNLNMYKKLNMFVDLSYYNNSFNTTNTLKRVRGANAYIELVKRLINDKRFTSIGYNKQTVIIPIDDWYAPTFHLINNSINPISCIYYVLLGSSPYRITDIFGDKEVLFLGKTSYMKINFSKLEDPITAQLFYRNIKRIADKEPVEDEAADNVTVSPANIKMAANARPQQMAQISSKKAIKVQIIDDLEKSQKIKIDDITSGEEVDKDASPETIKKKELIKTIEKSAARNNTVNDTLTSLDNNDEDAERLKKILSDLTTNPDDRGNNISGARASRMLQLQNDFLDSEFEGKKISDIINADSDSEPELKPVSLKVDSVNPEWKDLKFAATLESYNLDDDIVRIFGCFSDKSNPLAVRNISKEDTSTSNDLKETYTVNYEAATGKRYTVKLDIPKFIDNKYMVLRGNKKNIPIQLFLMPIIKTQEDTVQIVSCYKKIFIRRFGTTSGKSNPATDKLLKALNKEYKHIKVVYGDNSRICSKYEFPIDYIDIATNISIIETPRYILNFNYDEVLKKYSVDQKEGLCVGIDKKTKNPVYYKPDPKQPLFFSYFIEMLIDTSLSNTNERELFIDNFNNASTSVRYTYSRASIMDANIPVIVLCGLAEGLENTLKKANIKYNIVEKLPRYDKLTQDAIKFKDGYIVYDLNYNSCLLMNGLKQCPTEDYDIAYINSRVMYIDFLDSFGGRLKADGLDNFYDCMIDPITKETLKHYKLPTDYVSVLLHANLLLSDNKYTKHGDIRASRRFRKAEQIASYMYEVISAAYGRYSSGLKHGRNIDFSMKQSAVIDRLLIGNTTNDMSVLNVLNEYESIYAVTPQGPSGMNTDRAYSLDKRSFDDSMLNILSASTNHAGSVGITRQATIDANISGSRGYIYNDPDTNNDEINSVKTLCMTESLTPFSSTRDDPMRLAMGFIQTSKHGMRTDKSDPQLITSGADEALPYLVSNTFAYKAKDDGTVVEVVPDNYMIVEYKNEVLVSGNKTNKFEYINLKEEVQKNSSSGFYITLKLDTDLKVNSKFKKGDVIAYDKHSFDSSIGENNNLAYNVGTLAKYAILNTDEGYEDSAIISDALSEGLASDIVLEKVITVTKDTNIYNLVKKGQPINEGDTLLIVQNAYDEEDVNTLLRNLAGSEEEITNLGRRAITSKVTGFVQDIVIKRTCELNEMSPTLKKIVSNYEKEINNNKAKMKSYGIDDVNKTLPDTEALPATGDLKKAYDSVVIKIYLKYHDKFAVGCKLIYGTAVKGVAKDIFPKGKEPYSEYRPNETVHALLSIGSINARMVTSVLINNGINKGLIELSRRVKEMAGIPYDDNLLE